MINLAERRAAIAGLMRAKVPLRTVAPLPRRPSKPTGRKGPRADPNSRSNQAARIAHDELLTLQAAGDRFGITASAVYRAYKRMYPGEKYARRAKQPHKPHAPRGSGAAAAREAHETGATFFVVATKHLCSPRAVALAWVKLYPGEHQRGRWTVHKGEL